MALMNYTTDDAKDTSTNEIDEVSTDNFCVHSMKYCSTPTSQLFSGSVSDNFSDQNPTNYGDMCNKSCLQIHITF